MKHVHVVLAKNSSSVMANSKLSPLAPVCFPPLPKVKGVKLSVAKAGIKYQDRTDLWLAVFTHAAEVAGVFTKSKTSSAPVDWCRSILGDRPAKAVLVNSGNANAFTGSAGWDAVESIASSAGRLLQCDSNEIYLASTGVIGETLPFERVNSALVQLVGESAESNWEDSARAIMTTDTFPKGSGGQFELDEHQISIAGIAKGSGMIEPDMATMLGFIVTDIDISKGLLQQCLSELVTDSFNSITVDSDTSTSDTVLVFATGAAGNTPITSETDHGYAEFRNHLARVMKDLAVQIVRDGEGASKLITVDVNGAEDNKAARVIAKSIANSPLVKTAIAGEDANWGRVVMAVGKAGEKADRDKLCISMGGILIAENGAAVDTFDESFLTEHLQSREIIILVELGIGDGYSRVWGCDLTHDYIRINADYRS